MIKKIDSVRRLQRKDLPEATKLLNRERKTAFLDWETSLLSRTVNNRNTIGVVALNRGKVVAVLIGGVLGCRGEINHCVIAPEYRHNGIGGKLVKAALIRFARLGVRRVMLDVIRKNSQAIRFWESHGLRKTDDIHMEIDL